MVCLRLESLNFSFPLKYFRQVKAPIFRRFSAKHSAPVLSACPGSPRAGVKPRTQLHLWLMGLQTRLTGSASPWGLCHSDKVSIHKLQHSTSEGGSRKNGENSKTFFSELLHKPGVCKSIKELVWGMVPPSIFVIMIINRHLTWWLWHWAEVMQGSPSPATGWHSHFHSTWPGPQWHVSDLLVAVVRL